MTVLSAQTIKARNILTPCEERGIAGGMSFGLSQCGYDLRIAEKLIIPPGHFRLASTIERFTMPNDIVGVVHDKSSLARRGLAVQNTVIEPGWRGFLTLELTNHGNRVIDFEAGWPLAQVIFHLLDQPTDRPYSGKYQDQEAGPQPARIE